jgi:hypothetical protein
MVIKSNERNAKGRRESVRANITMLVGRIRREIAAGNVDAAEKTAHSLYHQAAFLIELE